MDSKTFLGGPGSELGPDMGPKITLQAIENNIRSVHFITGDKIYRPNESDPFAERAEECRGLTICMMVLQNGFQIVGTSACADLNNFDEKIGKKIAYQNCINQCWPLMGYELKSRLNRLAEVDDSDPLGEALTRLTAFHLGNPEVFRPQDAKLVLDKIEGDNRP